jgi:ABC-type Fe3+-siderophore transport system permease subunit
MKLDHLEEKTLRFVIFISFFVFFFLPFELGMKIFFISLISYFLILFILCTYWAREWHPERKFIIGFLVSFLHTFIFLFSGVLGLVLAQIALKFFPFLVDYLREIWKF